MSKAADVCVSGLSRACDGLTSWGCGGDGGLRCCQAGSITLVNQPQTAGRSRLPGSGPHTVELQRRQVAHKCPRQLAKGQPPNACGPCSVEVVHASKPPVRLHPAAGQSRLPDGGLCSAVVIHTSKHPVHHHPAAGRSRLSDGGPCSEEVVYGRKHPVLHHPAAGRSRLPDGGPCSVVVACVVHARKPPGVAAPEHMLE